MRHVFFRIGIIFALLITMGATSVSASNAHHCLIGEPITTWKTTDNWSKNYEEFALTSPANTNWDEFCIYMWVETNQTFAFNNHFFNPGEAKQVGPSSDQATINKDGGTGVGVATDGTTNAWKYTGATGLVKICAAQSSGGSGQGEWKPYVWVEESKEIEILKGNKIMFYFGSSTGKGEHNWLYLSAKSTTSHSASEQYHRLNETKCTSYISVAYVDAGIRYYISDYSSWAGVQMESTAEAGCLYSVYNDGSDKIYKNVSVGAIPHFATTTVNKTVGAVNSKIAATVTKSIYGNEQVLYYYYTTDGGTTFTKFDPSDISSLAVGVYTVYALGWDGHILVRSDNTVTLNVGVTISLDANGGTDGDVTSVFATSGIAASTGNIAAASLPTKTGYTFNGFCTSEGIEVINENGEWKTDVSGYTDNSGNWICLAASTLYAHWTPKTYIVTLEGMEADGESLPISVDVTYDAVLPLLETKHTKAHYDFGGYWTSSNGGSTLTTQLIDERGNWKKSISDYTGASGDDPTWVHADNITLYAKWTEHEYDITIAVEGSGKTSPASSTIGKIETPSGDIIATPGTGYSFKEWDFSKQGESDYDVWCAGGYNSDDATIRISAKRNGTLTAKFTANNYNVNLENLEATTAGTESVTATYDATLSAITIPTKAHYDFGGYWTSTDEGAHLTTQLIDADGAWIADVSGYTNASKQWIYAGDITLYAKWTEHEYDITIAVEGSGKTSPASSTIGKIETPSGDIIATPGTGYSFKEWDFSKQGESDYDVWCAAGYNSTNATIRILAKRDGTLTAKFTANNYTVGLDNREADPEHGGTASVNVTYDATTGLTSAITPPQKEHYTFGGYYISTDSGATLTNIQLIDASGNWNTGVSGYIDGSKRWICAGDTMLYAKWTENLYSVTVTAGANGSVSPSSVSNIGYVTASGDITATADAGYHFVSWTLPANVPTAYSYIATSNPIRIRATASGQTITANFAATNYTVTLDNREPTTSGTTSVSVTYNATTNLTSDITPPQKEHYIFGGYFTEVGGAGTQLINADGSWIKDVTGYTSHDGDNPKWVLADDLTLYAKWTETMYPVAIAILPAGAGNVQVSGETVTEVTAGYATHSPELTAVPSNAAWVFKEWRVDEKLHLVLQSYSQFGEKMKIFATGADQGLTAVFEKRYNLVGSKYEIDKDKEAMATGGMPGWTFGSGADFTINSYTADGDDAIVDLSYTCTLEAGTYIFEIHDRKKGESLGRKDGTSIYVLKDGDNVELRGGEGQDQSIFFYPEHEGQYTFRITNMRKEGEYYYPTVTVERPHAVYFGTGYAGIDDLSSVTSGTAGGTLEVTTSSGALANEDYVTYGTNVTYTPSPKTGYTFEGFYTSNEFTYRFTQNNPWIHYNLTGDDHVYAKFVEKATTVTLSNDGHGKVQINSTDQTSTTCGVTTTRQLNAVPNSGYSFSSWSITGSDISLSATNTNPTTLSGLGAGAVSGQEVRANFIERWIVQPEVGEWGYAHFTIEHIEEVGGKTIGYVDITLEANTNYQFSVMDRDGDVKYKNGSDQVYYMTNGNSHNWGFATDKSFYCGITTAGAGVYRFTWNITDKKMTVTYPNFIIYRTGDKDGDKRATEDDVESYAGGTISQVIEFRMKVNELDYWYTLCLPFTVTAVKVWDEEDGQYYDIVPYYRKGDKYYTGHYIIRTPVYTTDFAIENFDSRDRWVDPSRADGYLPSANTPYIIQWHTDGDNYFLNKYISFFGATGQTIPTSMNQEGSYSYASSDETVNIYGNNSMTTVTVRDAYLLDPYYGPDGAWMREELGTDRSVLPFECFILANPATTAKYRVLRRDMADDTPTGLDTLSMTEDSVSKVMINNRIYIIRGGKMYTIQGTFVKEVE